MSAVGRFFDKMGHGKAALFAVTFAGGCSFGITSYIRSIGADYGGSSTGQPVTTGYQWRTSTEGYLKAQKCNPIRNGDGRAFE